MTAVFTLHVHTVMIHWFHLYQCHNRAGYEGLQPVKININIKELYNDNYCRATEEPREPQGIVNGQREWYSLRFGILVSPSTPEVLNEFCQKQDLFETLDSLHASPSSYDRDDAFDHLNRVCSDRLAVLGIGVRFTPVGRRGRSPWRNGLWFPLEPTTETHFEHPATGN